VSVRRFTPLVRVARCRRTICLLMERPLPGIEFGDGGVADGSIGALYERRLAGSTIHETGLPESGCSPPAPYAADLTQKNTAWLSAMGLDPTVRVKMPKIRAKGSSRPIASTHHRQLSVYPVQLQSEAVRGIRLRALCGQLTVGQAVIRRHQGN